MDNQSAVVEKLAQMIDNVGALLECARIGVEHGEAVERTIARLDELLEIVKG